jgi:thioredoxin-dependent peroxiredoxin
LTVIGPKLNRSEIASDFTLDHFDGQASQGVRLTDSDGSIRILNVMNSLDTPICDIETRRWEQRAVFALVADRRLVHVECVDDQM